MAIPAPAWATELEEEWIESSPSPPHVPAELPVESLTKLTADSIRAKRGSLRALGHAAPRSLPLSRSNSAKIVSGHGEGRALSERSDNLPVEDVLSPTSYRSSSNPEEVPGTFVVKEGVEDDRGKALARKGRDMFGPSALEKMFQPPSPPALPQQAGTSSVQAVEPRRPSHAYAPTNPSRLSKSVTPSTASSITMSELPSRGHQENSAVLQEMVAADSTSSLIASAEEDSGERQSGPFSPPDHAGFPFTFEAPLSPSRQNDSPEPFGPLDNELSHSTVHHRPQHKTSPRTGLRLFRSTYDTYTREHLSALVDSIAIEPSPSPPSLPNAKNLRDWSPDASPSGSSEVSDLRSSKRMRMSPASPRRQDGGIRDWGAQGRAMLDRIRGTDVESGTSASRSRSQTPAGEEMQDGKLALERNLFADMLRRWADNRLRCCRPFPDD